MDLPELEDIPGGILDVTALDAADGRLLVLAGWEGRASVAALNEASDAVEIVEEVGRFSGGVGWRGHTRSRSGNALVVSLDTHYLYFRDGAFVCAMPSSRPHQMVTVTDDDFILVNGDLMTTCTAEHEVNIGIGSSIVETDNGFGEVLRHWESRSVWVVALYPLEKLLALAPLTTPLQ
jgi:hypothetical protein